MSAAALAAAVRVAGDLDAAEKAVQAAQASALATGRARSIPANRVPG
jgi:predicted RNA polymerase sigma factor